MCPACFRLGITARERDSSRACIESRTSWSRRRAYLRRRHVTRPAHSADRRPAAGSRGRDFRTPTRQVRIAPGQSASRPAPRAAQSGRSGQGPPSRICMNSCSTVLPALIVRLIPSIVPPAGAVHISPEPGSPCSLAQHPLSQLKFAIEGGSARATEHVATMSVASAILLTLTYIPRIMRLRSSPNKQPHGRIEALFFFSRRAACNRRRARSAGAAEPPGRPRPSGAGDARAA